MSGRTNWNLTLACVLAALAVCNLDEDSGTCVCALHHTSSDSRGGIGLLNDCGAVDEFAKRGSL